MNIDYTNSEKIFFNFIKNKIELIFDVGCRNDSEFTIFNGEVHYFDPQKNALQNLMLQQPNLNKKNYFNNFGLGNNTQEQYYYPNYQSFYNRIESMKQDDDPNKIILKIKKSKEYVQENNITSIDFLKIDTEGYELNVLLGFEDFLKNIKIIQFEYGGTFLDNGVKLKDVILLLLENGFHKFAYLSNEGPIPITNYDDHYQYCNVVCYNKNSDIVPY